MRLALIGAGKWGANFLRTLAASELDELTVIVSSQSREKIDTIAKTSATLITDLGALKSCAHELDGAIVATPPGMRPAIVAELLRLGIPVLAEKPLSLDAETTADLVSLAQSLRVPLIEDFIHLYSWPYLTLLEQLDTGTPITIDSSGGGWGPFRDYSPLADYGPHDVAMALHLFGRLPDTASLAVTELENAGAFTADVILDFTELGVANIKVSNIGSERVRKFNVLQGNESWLYDGNSQNLLVRNGIAQSSPLQEYSPMQLLLDCFGGRRTFYNNERSLWLSKSVAEVLQNLEVICSAQLEK
ncbi:MAG: Gfo/Idh/MocA family protein [Halioglobus sp.]